MRTTIKLTKVFQVVLSIYLCSFSMLFFVVLKRRQSALILIPSLIASKTVEILLSGVFKASNGVFLVLENNCRILYNDK